MADDDYPRDYGGRVGGKHNPIPGPAADEREPEKRRERKERAGQGRHQRPHQLADAELVAGAFKEDQRQERSGKAEAYEYPSASGTVMVVYAPVSR